jgi:hypothetical protein
MVGENEAPDLLKDRDSAIPGFESWRPARPGARRCLLAVLLLAAVLIPFAMWGEGLELWVGAGRWTEMNAALAAAMGAVLLTADVLLPVPSSVPRLAGPAPAWNPLAGAEPNRLIRAGFACRT